jgi:AcrR family transcriptional regulator
VNTSSPPDWKTTADDAKRGLILDAALRVFGTRGFDEPSMDDVAAEADYTRRSLYRFFSSKEELGMALAVRSCQRLMEAVGPGGPTSLFDFVWLYWRFSRDHPDEFRVVLETRQLLLAGRTLPLQEEWLQTDGFGQAFAALGPVDRESLAAAVGYVEFRFLYRAVEQTLELSGDETVKTVLAKILSKEPI